MTGVTYRAGTGNAGNGTSGTFSFDTRGRLQVIEWFDSADQQLTKDWIVNRSASGRVKDQRIDTGGEANPAGDDFSYDGAGRLVDAWVPGHHYTYGFGTPTGCASGDNADAGKNTNRVLMTDTPTGQGTLTTTSCYDHADKLTATTASGLGTIAYDAHGSTTTLGAQTFKYDGADRHVESTASGTTVRYVRDATGRIVARTVTGSQSQSQRYSFGGGGDSASVVLDTSNQVIERSIGLPGGVSLTKRGSGDVWSYPNIHGDVAALANSTGAKQGNTFTYDPYGNTLGGVPDNSDGSLDYGWLGGHQRGLEHATDLQPVIEMGARQYHPLLGRFLEVDPIEGGSCNDYDYTCADPINTFDLDGLAKKRKWWKTNPRARAILNEARSKAPFKLRQRKFVSKNQHGVVKITRTEAGIGVGGQAYVKYQIHYQARPQTAGSAQMTAVRVYGRDPEYGRAIWYAENDRSDPRGRGDYAHTTITVMPGQRFVVQVGQFFDPGIPEGDLGVVADFVADAFVA